LKLVRLMEKLARERLKKERRVGFYTFNYSLQAADSSFQGTGKARARERKEREKRRSGMSKFRSTRSETWRNWRNVPSQRTSSAEKPSE
jgi:hypothetical protein